MFENASSVRILNKFSSVLVFVGPGNSGTSTVQRTAKARRPAPQSRTAVCGAKGGPDHLDTATSGAATGELS